MNYAETINSLTELIHVQNVNAKWWTDLKTGKKIDPLADSNMVPAKLCLVHSEISEAMEGHRKSLMDDKLPDRPMIEVELADAVIRIADLAGALDLDLGGAIMAKLEYNANRADHKPEMRVMEGGKTY